MIENKRKTKQIILIGLLICIVICTLPVMAASTTAGTAEITALDKNIIKIHYTVNAVDTTYDVTGKIYYTGETKSVCEFDIFDTDGLYVDTPDNMRLDITKPLSVDIIVHNEKMGDPNAKPTTISIGTIDKSRITVFSDVITQSEKIKWTLGKYTPVAQIAAKIEQSEIDKISTTETTV